MDPDTLRIERVKLVANCFNIAAAGSLVASTMTFAVAKAASVKASAPLADLATVSRDFYDTVLTSAFVFIGLVVAFLLHMFGQSFLGRLADNGQQDE